MRRLAWFFYMFFVFLGLLGVLWIHSAVRSKAPVFTLVQPGWFLCYVLLTLLVNIAVGVPGPFNSLKRAAFCSVLGAAITTFSFALATVVFGPWLLPRPVVLGTGPLVTLCVSMIASYLYHLGWRSDRDRTRVLLIATELEKERLVNELQRNPVKPARLTGFVDALSDISGAELEGRISDAGPSVIVLSEVAQRNAGYVRQASLAHGQGLRVRSLTSFYDEWLGRLPLSELARMSLLFDVASVHRVGYRRTKRAIDLAAGFCGMIPFVLVAPFVAIGNRFLSRGPLFFRQERIGENGVSFTMFKFRSMRPSDRSEGEWTKQDDDRITALGRFLRRSHLDELPQVLNLLQGSISLVGPRPEQGHYVAALSKSIPYYEFRHSVRPGITGWAQIRYPYGASEQDAIEKLEHELYYIAHQSIWLDLQVIGKTVVHVLFGEGR